MELSPASSEVPKESGAAARSSQMEGDEPRQDPEFSSGNNGDGEHTVVEEDEVAEQGGAESSKASQEQGKKKKGLPKG